MRHSPGTMKLHLCLFLALASLLTAQDKPKDPFVKDKQAAGAAAPAPSPVPDGLHDSRRPVVKNVRCFLETFTLPQGDYAALLDAPDGHDKLYPQLLAAVKAGTAKLDGCHLITTHSGIRCVLECTDELIYPTEWTAADRDGTQYPTAFEMHALGDRFEFEPSLVGDSGALHITQQFTRDRLQGLRLFKADTTLAGVPVVDIFVRTGTATCRMIPGCPTLITTLKGTQPGDMTLVFATPEVVDLPVPQTPVSGWQGNLILTARVISLDRMQGWELLKKHAMEGVACLAALKPLLTAKEATLEHIATITTKSGVRALHESGLLYPYGTEYAPPAGNMSPQPSGAAKKPAVLAPPAGLAGTTAFESRNLGFRLEVEPAASEDGVFADLVLAPEFVSMKGNLKDKNWSEHYPEVPLISNQKLTTGYTQVIGTTALIGTMNPPGDTGANEHKDDGRMWLLFMDVNRE